MAQKKRLKPFLLSLARSLTRRSPPSDPASFRSLFERFKNVLDSNNRALETITDIAEKLGGDYLFDIVYVRNSYARLKKDMLYSVRAFDTLTANRYPKLHEAFGRIDELIEQVLTETEPAPAPLVSLLKDIPWGSTRASGGKMAQLAEVKNQIGIDVPDGFVITTAAFSEFMRSNNLEPYLDRLKQGRTDDSELEELRELILQGRIPDGLHQEIRKGLDKLRRHAPSLLSVRSSAEEEDSTHSFAGQFRSVLGVPPESPDVELAYRKVIASLFSAKAVSYQQQTGFEPGSMKMAVGCMVMADAAASGVLYTVSPEGDPATMVISAAWGLGESIVEGRTATDLYRVRKGKEPLNSSVTIGRKETMIVLDRNTGTIELPVEPDRQDRPCLSEDQIRQLALIASRIERYFGSARDIEWAIDKKDRIWILQARPLNVQTETIGSGRIMDRPDEGRTVLFNAGSIVQQGAGAGKVFLAKKPDDIATLPRGAVLVASHDSSLLVRSMPFVSAIITETGSPTSHMAAVCRELKIPTIVNVPGATSLLEQGQEITVLAGDDGVRIYSGIIPGLLAGSGPAGRTMEAVYEFRRKRYLLRYVSPLHLIDPLMDDFVPERCRTMHDILRFMHEKSVAELVDRAREGSASLQRRGTLVPLDLPVPAGLLVMDMGGGLAKLRSGAAVTIHDIASVPFRAIVRGMIHPGAWRSEPVALGTGDLLSSMMRMPDITTAAGSTAGYNVAVISREYVNMSIRFGYHFNMIDCYCSEKAKNNHIYFRFAGGATDLAKRSRRLDLIARILTEYGFAIRIKGDLLIARLAGLAAFEMDRVLDQVGRLVSYARQLDAVLRDDRDIDSFAADFLAGNYDSAEKSAERKR